MKRMIGRMVLVCTLAFNVSLGALMSAPVSMPAVAVIGGVALVCTSQTGCSKSQLVAAAEDVLTVVTDQGLIAALQAISPDGVSKLAGLVPSARDLVAAIKNGNTTNGLALVNTIFPVVDQIVSGVNNDPKVRGFLSLGNIALHFIINHTQANMPRMARANPAVRQAQEYGSQPVWGCDLRNDKRCKQLTP